MLLLCTANYVVIWSSLKEMTDAGLVFFCQVWKTLSPFSSSADATPTRSCWLAYRIVKNSAGCGRRTSGILKKSFHSPEGLRRESQFLFLAHQDRDQLGSYVCTEKAQIHSRPR